jgi:AcrR family transcriptional regulator
MTGTVEPGLRERKRLATRRAILVAAIEIVRDRGLDAATVDEISRVADVSPRTFFNYFSSKEEAILGDTPHLPDDDVVDAFTAARGPIMSDLSTVFVGLANASPQGGADQELAALRRSLMKSHPELSARRMASLHEFEMRVIDIVHARLVVEHPDLEADPPALRSRARLVAFIAIAAMRTAWQSWVDAGESSSASLAERLRDSFAMVEFRDTLPVH